MENLSSKDVDDLDFDIDVDLNDPILKQNEMYDGYVGAGSSIENDEATIITPKCEFLTGGAGTGKTYEINRRMEEYRQKHPNSDRYYGILAATTGIAAINLGGDTTTVNSCLKYFDTISLEESFNSGKLQQSLKEISRKANNLIIDEISMMHAKQLDLIWDALVEISQHEETKERGGLGIIITGDFCQLPPVPDKDLKTGKSLDVKYAFEALCWKHFEKNTTKLTKNWRQDDPIFIESLSAARKGDGAKCSQLLKEHKGVKFCAEIETNFDGTTIFSKNVEVDRLNQTRLRNLLHSGKKGIIVKSFRWGKQRGEWKNIPETLELCEECYVMILSNDSKRDGFRYANGTTGYVVRYNPPVDREKLIENIGRLGGVVSDIDDTVDMLEMEENIFDTPNTFLIKLKSNENLVEIGKICRQVSQREHPEGVEKPSYDSLKEWKENNSEKFSTQKQGKFLYEGYLRNLTREGKEPAKIYFDYENGKWIVGEIFYFPLRIAYASTCHKSQGLTLDKVQIDFVNQFFGSPSMAYVALSRCKTAEGMRLVGSPRLLEERINVSRKVVRFI